MPRGDGTGPMGQGPMSGWGNGWCVNASPEKGNPLDHPRGRGGRFLRRGANQPAEKSPAPQAPTLTAGQELEALNAQLDDIKQRILELEATLAKEKSAE